MKLMVGEWKSFFLRWFFVVNLNRFYIKSIRWELSFFCLEGFFWENMLNALEGIFCVWMKIYGVSVKVLFLNYTLGLWICCWSFTFVGRKRRSGRRRSELSWGCFRMDLKEFYCCKSLPGSLKMQGITRRSMTEIKIVCSLSLIF